MEVELPQPLAAAAAGTCVTAIASNASGVSPSEIARAIAVRSAQIPSG